MTKTLEEIKAIEQVISKEDCKANGQAIGDHYFIDLNPGTVCNCTICYIIAYKFPWLTLQVNNLFIRIDLRSQ